MRSSLTTDPGTSALLSAAVVIRARNEKRFIGRTLAAIVDPAALQPRQVVVVDSVSTDGTLDILRAFGITLVQIRPQDFTYGYALNRGVAQTDADIVVSLSAHSTPAGPDWLRRLLEPFADPRAQLVRVIELPERGEHRGQCTARLRECGAGADHCNARSSRVPGWGGRRAARDRGGRGVRLP